MVRAGVQVRAVQWLGLYAHLTARTTVSKERSLSDSVLKLLVPFVFLMFDVPEKLESMVFTLAQTVVRPVMVRTTRTLCLERFL